MIGAQISGNFFLTRKDFEAMRPLLEVANRHRAALFIHNGPRPGDAYPKVQRHARHASEPVLGDGDTVPDRLPRALSGRDHPRPQFGRQHPLHAIPRSPGCDKRRTMGGATGSFSCDLSKTALLCYIPFPIAS